MAGYANITGRAELTEQLVPDQWITDIIKVAPEESVMLSRARTVRMSAKKSRQPVIASLPDAYWVDGEAPDTGLKQTDKVTWKGVILTAEELAVIVPIPDAVIDDALVPLWPEVAPLLREAIGKKIDQAAFFGVDKPASWPTGIVPAASAAGNVSQISATNKLADAFLSVAQTASQGGFSVNGFVTEPGLNWALRGEKDGMGQFVFGAPTAGGTANLFGFSLDECRNGAWNSASAVGLALDWSKFVIGIRQDITYDLFREGVISDEDGAVVLNLMQQDCKAMRVVMRVGFQVAVPATRLSTTAYPAGIITPAAAAGGKGGE